jgi:hypothetical protein
MPAVETTDSARHRNDLSSLANKRERETHRSFQSNASSTKVKVEVVEENP